MEHFLRHSTQPDRAGSPRTWRQVAPLIATWLWPPATGDAGARQDDGDATAAGQPQHLHGDDAWRIETMRWVPLVVPLAALGMLLLAVLIGTRLY